MTKSTVAFTDRADSREAGAQLGRDLMEAFDGEGADAAIVFASAEHDYAALLTALDAAGRPAVMVGCSSAGEFTSRHRGEHSACAVGIRSDVLKFAAGIGRGLSADCEHAAASIAASFADADGDVTLFRSALVMNDALAGRGDELVEHLNARTGGVYRFFGGGAGDDARFSRTHVFHGTEAVTDAAVALEILSPKPLGIGVFHGWEPASRPFRVTQAEGMRLIGIDGSPAAEVVEEYAEEAGLPFDPEEPLAFFLHNVIGVDTGSGFKLRVPLSIGEDGSLACAAEIPEGATIHFMRTSVTSAVDAAAHATRSAVDQLNGDQPEVALFFDCVATRLRMGEAFDLELQALQTSLGEAKYAGCNTYGQIASAPGQFSGFHNCTAVVCVIPA